MSMLSVRLLAIAAIGFAASGFAFHLVVAITRVTQL